MPIGWPGGATASCRRGTTSIRCWRYRGSSPSIILFDVLREPLDFVYRLIGSRIRTHLMRDLTGVRMSSLDYQDAGSVIWGHQAWVVEHAAPRIVRPPYVGPHKDFLFIEAVILPLGSGTRVDKLMVFADFIRTLRPRPAPRG
jgi:hypothetical protein